MAGGLFLAVKPEEQAYPITLRTEIYHIGICGGRPLHKHGVIREIINKLSFGSAGFGKSGLSSQILVLLVWRPLRKPVGNVWLELRSKRAFIFSPVIVLNKTSSAFVQYQCPIDNNFIAKNRISQSFITVLFHRFGGRLYKKKTP